MEDLLTFINFLTKLMCENLIFIFCLSIHPPIFSSVSTFQPLFIAGAAFLTCVKQSIYSLEDGCNNSWSVSPSECFKEAVSRCTQLESPISPELRICLRVSGHLGDPKSHNLGHQEPFLMFPFSAPTDSHVIARNKAEQPDFFAL